MLVEEISLSVQNVRKVYNVDKVDGVDNGQYSFGQTGRSDLMRINVSHLPTGVYYVRIGNATKMFVKI